MSKRSSDELADEQWAIIGPLLPEPFRRNDCKGRPRRENREVLDGILWILRSGARWKEMPDRFPPYQTCHRRFGHWVCDGVLRQLLEALARDLQEQGGLDLSECFTDGTFMVAKKGTAIGKTKQGKGCKLMALEGSWSSSRHLPRKCCAA